MIRAGDIRIPSWRDAHDQAERDEVDRFYRERLAERDEQRAEYERAESMSLPHISVERVRPAVKNEKAGPGRGIVAGLILGVVFWLPAVLVGVPIVKDAIA